ncbi:hypothetical protein [Actinoplanes sp. NPDC051851]|uniref:hypothetical protein n=1 Tax=Actinoplanes sp. NPDC051851 TaxID=3154753 RepID=UPI00343D2289
MTPNEYTPAEPCRTCGEATHPGAECYPRGTTSRTGRETTPTAIPRRSGLRGRTSRRAWIARATVAGAVTLGIAAIKILPATPRSTVTDYFGALADGDATAALALVDDDGRIKKAWHSWSQAQPLLSDAALADDRLRPHDLTIERITPSRNGSTLVSVTYRADGRTVAQTIEVRRTGDHDFRLLDPFVNLSIEGAAGRQVSIDAVGLGLLDTGVARLVAFPGAYEARAAATPALAESTVTVVPEQLGDDAPYATVSFPVP